jgi:hypothetical protein
MRLLGAAQSRASDGAWLRDLQERHSGIWNGCHVGGLFLLVIVVIKKMYSGRVDKIKQPTIK